VSTPPFLLRGAPWWSLLLVPSAFLANLSVAYAVVPYACMTMRHGLIHIAPALCAVAALTGILLCAWAVRRARRDPSLPPERHFLSLVALAVAGLFLLATLAQWYVVVALTPCQQ
jgi:hypothetical protein